MATKRNLPWSLRSDTKPVDELDSDTTPTPEDSSDDEDSEGIGSYLGEREVVDVNDFHSEGETDASDEEETTPQRPPSGKGHDKFDWSQLPGTWKKAEPIFKIPEFTDDPGPTTPFLEDTPALEFFSLYFSNNVWELITRETNRYAEQNCSTSPGARKWSPVTIPEMKAFVGVMILMGVLDLPRLEMYWQQAHPLLKTQIPMILSRNRFEQILRFLHLADSTTQPTVGQPGYDKLYKVRPLLDMISSKLEHEYTLHQHVSVDEAIIPFKGRIFFKQYMKNKPVKWGIKVFVLADATNGYIYRLEVYTGKSVDETRSLSAGLASQVVIDLLGGLEEHHNILYTDNYYTSPLLFLYLYERGINACGTVRVNRKGYPRELTVQGKKRGSYDYRSNGPLLATVWYDRRKVNFLSTAHHALPTTSIERQDKKERVMIECPSVVPDYQRYMRGVDRGDQMIQYYNAGRRGKKWWKRIFFYLIEVAILNAYILEGATRADHEAQGHAKRDFLSFRLEVAELLVGDFRGRHRAAKRRLNPSEERLNVQLGHFPVFTPNVGDCVACSKEGKKKKLDRKTYRRRSAYVCCVCDVHLCMGSKDCFRKYHTLVEYWK